MPAEAVERRGERTGTHHATDRALEGLSDPIVADGAMMRSVIFEARLDETAPELCQLIDERHMPDPVLAPMGAPADVRWAVALADRPVAGSGAKPVEEVNRKGLEDLACSLGALFPHVRIPN